MNPRLLTARALSAVRHGREVLWTPEFMGLGNLLSLCRTAHDARADGRQVRVLETPSLRAWTGTFPGLGELSIARSDVGFFEQRLFPWASTSRDAADAPPFSVDMTTDFVRSRLLTSPVLERARAEAPPDRLVVNVRRGDYYSVPEHRAEFGFDLATYLEVAVDRSIAESGVPSAIHVVSDEPTWCHDRLGWMSQVAPVTFSTDSDSAAANFAEVSAGRRLVLSNSTFSYWAGFVSNAWYADNHADVVVPRFFSRYENGGYSRGLDSRWSIVEELPGGWDERSGDPQ